MLIILGLDCARPDVDLLNMKLLGIGSRIIHAEYGKGVVTNLSSKHYWVSFFDTGLETIDIDSDLKLLKL